MKIKILFGVFLFASTHNLSAETKSAEKAVNDSIAREVCLNEFIITSARRPEPKLIVPQQTYVFKQATIESANVQTTADLLTEQGTLFVQKSQQGGGSPVLRGFEASRVLIIVDHVKLNNLIYRAGHLQNVITIDQSMLQQVDVLFGSSSVIYGSDALGGVVHFQTKNPELKSSSEKPTKFKANVFYRTGTANNEQTGHLDFNIGGYQFASLTSLSYSKLGDLISGKSSNPFLKNDQYITRNYYVEHIGGRDSVFINPDKSLQRGSRYSQYDLLQKFIYKPNNQLNHVFNVQLSNSSNINRFDRLTEMQKNRPKYAEWYYGPQFRLLSSYELNSTGLFGADQANIVVAFQKVKESRHNRKLKDNILENRNENVTIVSLSSDWIKAIHDHTLHAGADITLNYLSSTAYAEDVDTRQRKTLNTRYPDGNNSMCSYEVFFIHRWSINNKLNMIDGVRLGYSTLLAQFNNKTFFPFLQNEVNQNNITYSVNWGLNYLPTPYWRFAVLVSTGFRVPNIDDLGKVFDSRAGMVIVPNPDIKPEKSLNLEFNVTKTIHDRLIWENAIYGTSFFDAITLAPTMFNGRDSIVYDNQMSRVYSNQNSRRAFILGVSSTLQYQFTRNLTAESAINYSYGKIISDSPHNPLDHIPPLFGKIGVKFDSNKKKWNVMLYSLFNGKKALKNYNLLGEDNIGYATVKGEAGEGLPAWFTINLKAGWQLHPNVALQVGVENMFDTAYRTFASGINNSGRNLYVVLRVKL